MRLALVPRQYYRPAAARAWLGVLVVFLTVFKAGDAIGASQMASVYTASPSQTFEAEPREYYRSIEELGFERGFQFDGPSVKHVKTFSFEIPRDTPIEGSRFRLIYRASALLNEIANLSIEANGEPLYSRFLARHNSLQDISVEVPPHLLDEGRLDVSVLASLPLSTDRCVDERMQGSFLHMLPQSGLELEYQSAGSMRDAWLLLPEEVVVSLPPGKLSPQDFNLAWALVDLLYRKGHEVRFKRMPELGDIVIADRQSIVSAVARRLPSSTINRELQARALLPDGNENLFRVTAPGSDFIAVSGLEGANALYLLSKKWNSLAVDNRFSIRGLDYPASQGMATADASETGAFSIPLSGLGFDTRPRYIGDQIEWNVGITPADIPMGTRPERMNMKLIVPVRDSENSYELYVYLNDVLLQVERLQPTGAYQDVTVTLPQHYQRPANYLRVLMKRDGMQGDCLGPVSEFPVQIAPESHLIVVQDKTELEKFSDLPRYFVDGFDVYLANDMLESLEALKLLANLTSSYPLAVDFSRVSFHASEEKIAPRGPFVAFGELSLDGISAPVSFDNGTVEVIDRYGKRLLDVDGLQQLVVSQLVSHQDSGGLWVRFADLAGAPVFGELRFSSDDVAFADHTGLVMTIDSNVPTLARVYYPEIESWFDAIAGYRFWILSLAWLLLTLVVIYLYHKSRQHDASEVSPTDGQDNAR